MLHSMRLINTLIGTITNNDVKNSTSWEELLLLILIQINHMLRIYYNLALNAQRTINLTQKSQ